MNITTEQIKILRDATGVSVMQCKKALEEAGGDMEKAKIILHKISKQSAEKKSGRTLGAGTIGYYIHSNGSVGSMVELLCETDFVAKNQEFISLARDIAMHITAMSPQYVSMDDVSDNDLNKAKEHFSNEADPDRKKQAEIRDKIIAGKLAAYFSEKVLLDQKFIKDPETTIRSLVEHATQKFGERTEIGKFVRLSIN